MRRRGSTWWAASRCAKLVTDELGGRHAAERREPLEELAADLARSRARELAIDTGA